MDHARRNLLRGRPAHAPPPIRPPGATDNRVVEACTSCGACVAACPTNIIALGDGRLPEISFGRGECLFCGQCADACPEPVFSPQQPSRFAHVAAIGASCLSRMGIFCQSCGEACPEDAIRFEQKPGGVPVPTLAEAACTGCGACIAVCPASAIEVHQRTQEAAHA